MSHPRREWPALLHAAGHDSFGSCYVCASLATPTRPYAAVSGKEYCDKQKTWWGTHIFRPLTDDESATDLKPQIHFLAFPREVIIRIAGNLEEGREKAPLKPGSFSTVSGKIQFCARLRQASQAWPVVVFQLLSVTFVIRTFFQPLFSAESALIKLSARVCAVKVPQLLTVSLSVQVGNAHGSCRLWTREGLLKGCDNSHVKLSWP